MWDSSTVGEKFIAWTDETPRLDEILTTISLWWMLETFPKAIYPYREVSSSLRRLSTLH